MAETEQKPNKEIGYIKPREIVEEMKDSYLDYAMSVIISRALPDVRDGLKPVHRRILFAMNEDGLRHNVKFRKSATVVGSCLGRYHPHGDMAVYDSLVRMAQDFSLRYPLIHGQGNWGNIDGDSAAAQRYCVTGDSMVVTNRCLEKIDEVSKKEDISLKILSFSGKINNASKWFNSGIHPVIKIETLRGYSLKGTANHPIIVLEKNPQDGKPSFKWKLLSEIKKGDISVIDRNKKVLWPSKEPLLKKFFPVIGDDNRCFVYELPKRMNSDLAFVLGFLLAEGFISSNQERHYSKTGVCNTDRKIIKDFKLKFKKLFPGCNIYSLIRNPLSYGKKTFVSLEICSNYLTEFFKNIGLKEVKSHEKEVPHIIFHSSKKSVAAFLQGFVEGDGCVFFGKKGKGVSSEVRFISVSKKLLIQIQILLLRFGIDSFLREDKYRNYWFLSIRGDNLELFKEIGFFSRKKKERLEKAVERNHDAFYNKFTMSKTDFIPFLADYLRDKYTAKNTDKVFKEWLLKNNIDRYPKLKKNYKTLKQNLEKDDLEMIKFLISQKYLFDKIISKTSDGQERVYSFRVDSQCHSYVSNGFISHNTECRMSAIGEEMLTDIDKNTVDFRPNYDATREEPVVLPSPVPQLLLNGSLGIAVGMATNIPPHNLTEVLEATIYLIDRPNATTEDLFEFIKGPDFPTGGLVYGKKDIVSAYSQGKGPMLTRGKAEINEQKKGNFNIIISEIPFLVQKSELVKQFARLVEEKKIEGVKNIRDESDREGMRIVIELKKEAFPKKVLNALYKYTDLQKTFHLNMLALVDGIQPKVLSLVDALSFYLKHKKEVILRRTKFDLERAKERAHILEGLMVALKNIDEVIRTIKKSSSREEAKINLMKKFKLTEVQAVAILEMKLQNLAKLEREKIEKELKELQERIKELILILKKPEKVKELMKKEFKEMLEKYRDERRTKFVAAAPGEIGEEELIPSMDAIIILTQGGFVKRVKPSLYKAQKRGGKGIMGLEVSEEDTVDQFLMANTLNKLLFFTDSGKVFQCLVWEIPEMTRISKGRGLLNFLEISQTEKILNLIPYGKEDEQKKKYLVMATKNGIIKKTDLQSFQNVRRNGLAAIKLVKDDLLKQARIIDQGDEIILATRKGKSIRFKEKDLRPMGRSAAGVKGMRMESGDEIIGMDIVKAQNPKFKTQNYLLTVAENGYGKRTKIEYYRLQKRGGSGIKTARLTDKTGELVFSQMVGDQGDLIVISKKGQVIRTALKSISVIGRSSSGVRVMKLSAGDKIATATCLQEPKENNEQEKETERK